MSLARVLIHPGQWPDALHRDLLDSLRRREINHKFHYDSTKQTRKWLELHQEFSPSRKDTGCELSYAGAFDAVAIALAGRTVHLIGLGCGGGQKDTRLLERLHSSDCLVSYTPCDVSVAMTLVARDTAKSVVAPESCSPLVCDLVSATDLAETLDNIVPPGAQRVITFFGMIPNFPPEKILPRLSGCLRPGDCLLFSANLAPGADYHAGVQRVLPQYDNVLTRDWLLGFLLDLGVTSDAGRMEFAIVDDANGLKRIEAGYHFELRTVIEAHGEKFEFQPGECIRMFYSYRYTPETISAQLARHGLDARQQWITGSEEEGVFLCVKR
jgi:uncharacterized SAM-dependent methyltransferase